MRQFVAQSTMQCSFPSYRYEMARHLVAREAVLAELLNYFKYNPVFRFLWVTPCGFDPRLSHNNFR